MVKLRILFCVSCVITLVVIAGCGNGGGSQGETTAGGSEAKSGGNLIVAREADNVSLDPTKVVDAESVWVNEQIFQTLYRPSDDGTSVVAELASSVDQSEDGKTLTFHLRQGVKFSTGDPLTAEDVVFSLDRARKSSSPVVYLDDHITEVTALDSATVTVKSDESWAPLLADVTVYLNGIIPADYAGMSEKEFWKSPIGTGPFMLKEWKRGESLTLVRNPYYWEEGKPYLDSVTYLNVPDYNQRLLQLKGKQAHVIKFPPLSSLDSLKAIPGIDVGVYPSTRVDMLIMNEKVKPYDDVHVRRAIAYALDREAMVKALLFGYGSPAVSYLAPDAPGYDPNVPALAYDLAKAKEEMSLSSVPNGFTTTYLAVGGEIWAPVVQDQLKEIGIDVKLRTVDINQVVGLQMKGDYEISFEYWTDAIPDPSERTAGLLDGKSFNSYFTGYQKDEVTALVDKAAREHDAEKRQLMYDQLQAIHQQDQPQVVLTAEPWAYAFASSVHGLHVTPYGNYRLQDVWME